MGVLEVLVDDKFEINLNEYIIANKIVCFHRGKLCHGKETALPYLFLICPWNKSHSWSWPPWRDQITGPGKKIKEEQPDHPSAFWSLNDQMFGKNDLCGKAQTTKQGYEVTTCNSSCGKKRPKNIWRVQTWLREMWYQRDSIEYRTQSWQLSLLFRAADNWEAEHYHQILHFSLSLCDLIRHILGQPCDWHQGLSHRNTACTQNKPTKYFPLLLNLVTPNTTGQIPSCWKQKNLYWAVKVALTCQISSVLFVSTFLLKL